MFFSKIINVILLFFIQNSTKLLNFLRGKQRKQKLIEKIDEIEQKLLENISSSSLKSVKINDKENNILEIWTVEINTSASKTPVVFIHGFMTGILDWKSNIQNIIDNDHDRPVYLFDLIGFGKSSRCKFSSEPNIVENFYLNSIEEWRIAMKLDKMILIANSFGCYLATSYAIRFKERVDALILEDPWGFDGIF